MDRPFNLVTGIVFEARLVKFCMQTRLAVVRQTPKPVLERAF